MQHSASSYRPQPLDFERLAPADQQRRAAAFAATMQRRRTVRDFAHDPLPDGVIDDAIRAAASAPSGANQQPWRFIVIRDREIKRRIREAAEAEERESYDRRMPDEWLRALAPLGTDWRKPFLEIAPALIVVFRIDYGVERDADGAERRIKHYYVSESVGIACGILLAALHHCRSGHIDAHPQPDGLPVHDSQSAREREAVSVDPGGLSGGGRHGADDHEEVPR